MPHKQVKVIYNINIAPNPKYCGYCIYKGDCCELFNSELKIVDKNCLLRCKECLKNETK
jgi:hypothetical protein